MNLLKTPTLRLLCLLGALAACATPAQAGERERLSLDQGWLFHLGDVPTPAVKGHGSSYYNGKADGAWGAAAADFDDSRWRRLDLPHDWAVEAPFDPDENASQGYRQRGIGWYRRYLQLPASDRGRHIELQFDAIATHSTVWVNGIVVNRNWSGYNGRSIDITPYLRHGDEANAIAVRVDAQAMEGWWYEGAGIYRHAWLVKRDAVHIATDGLHADPVKTARGWTLPVDVALESSADTAHGVTVDVSVTDPAGVDVARGSARVTVQPLAGAEAHLRLHVRAPRLWSLREPTLYRVSAVLREGGRRLDSTALQTGFRTLRFDPERGFFLNGEATKIQGACIHQDHAGVGVAVPESIWEFRLKRLKDMGVNAIRFAHNAPAAEVLAMTDRLGLLVLDENRHFNPSADYLPQLTWLVRRDRNHPSVMMWSIFNEEPLQGTEMGYEMARRLVSAVKALDTSRPVTAAMHSGLFAPSSAAQALDVVGVNYQSWAYDRYHQAHPTQPMTSTEDTSAYMSRGEFHADPAAHVFDSYDDQPASWGSTHRDAWRAIAERPFIAGSFLWTGIDYRGEPSPFEWPSASSFFGAMDLAAFPKAAFYIHQAHWVRERPIVKILPHWTWPGSEGRPIKVMVASNAARVRLLLNGKPVAEGPVDPMAMASFDVAYAPGVLEAVALRGETELARDRVETAGPPARLVLAPDRGRLANDGLDAVPVTVSAVDAQGRPVPIASALVRFALDGDGRVIGVGNGDPNSHEADKASERSLYNGLAQVILQSRRAGTGSLTLHASAPGLQGAQVELALRDVPAVASVPPAEPIVYLQNWRVSPAQATRPDPDVVLAGNDMNSWGWGEPPMRQEPESPAWRLYRSGLKVRDDANDGHARLVFRNVAGSAEVWVDGVKLGEKADPRPGPLSVPLPAGAAERQVTLVLRSRPEEASGLLDRIVLERGP